MCLLSTTYSAGEARERHEVASLVFSELVVAGQNVAQLTAKSGFGVLLARSFGQKLPGLKNPVSEPLFVTIDVPNFAEPWAKRDPPDTSVASFAAHSGEGEIRTHGPLSWTMVFKTIALNHSATSPWIWILRRVRDSNPRSPCGDCSLVNCCYRPLSQLSIF